MREVVQLHHFQVNNLLDGVYQPQPCGLIVKEALGMVGEELLYCLYTYNCEHFVTWLRYGRAESRQVRTPPPSLQYSSSHLLPLQVPVLAGDWNPPRCSPDPLSVLRPPSHPLLTLTSPWLAVVQVRMAAVIVGAVVAAAAVAVVAATVMCLLRDDQQGGATLADLA